MRKLALFFFIVFSLFLVPSTTSAQEACTYRCTRGSEFSGSVARCKATNSDLTTPSISVCEAGKIPSTSEYSESCVCNPPALPPPATLPAPKAGMKYVTKACAPNAEGDTLVKSTTIDRSTGVIAVECPSNTACIRRSVIGGLSETWDCVDSGQPAPVSNDRCTGRDCTSGSGKRCNTSDGSEDARGAGISTAIGCIPTEPQPLIQGLLRYGSLAAGGVAFVLMLLAAVQMITAEGNPNTIKTSQEKFYSAIIGLLLIIFSVLLLQVIGVDLLGLKGFGA